MQQAHQAGLVVGTGSGHNLDVGGALGGLVVGHRGKIGAGDDGIIAIAVGPQPHLAADFASRGSRVACDNLDLDSGIEAILDGGRHIGAHWVADGYDAQQRQCRHLARLQAVYHCVRLVGVSHLGTGKSQGTHGLGLIEREFVGRLLQGHPCHRLLAMPHDNLGRALDQQQALPAGALHNGCHIFCHRREGQLGHGLDTVADIHVIHTRIMQPEQQGALGGIAQCHDLALVAVVEKGGAVAGDALAHESARLVVAHRVAPFQAIEVGLIDLHLVLGERAGLVGTDDRGGAHGLAGMHAPNQIVVLQHLAHAQCKRQGDAHGQSLGHRHHDECDG